MELKVMLIEPMIRLIVSLYRSRIALPFASSIGLVR